MPPFEDASLQRCRASAVLIYEAQKHRPGLPAVLVTGYAGDGATLAVGEVAPDAAFTLLRKPVSATELGDLVAALLHCREQKE